MTKLPEHTRRMAQLVNRPGGLTAAEAVAAAETNIETIRERGLSDIAATIRGMHALNDPAQGGALYRSSNALVGVAAVFGNGGLGEVALSLCTLIDRLSVGQRWDKAAIQLHLDSLRLLSQGSSTGTEMTRIVAALRQVVDRLQPLAAKGGLN